MKSVFTIVLSSLFILSGKVCHSQASTPIPSEVRCDVRDERGNVRGELRFNRVKSSIVFVFGSSNTVLFSTDSDTDKICRIRNINSGLSSADQELYFEYDCPRKRSGSLSIFLNSSRPSSLKERAWVPNLGELVKVLNLRNCK